MAITTQGNYHPFPLGRTLFAFFLIGAILALACMAAVGAATRHAVLLSISIVFIGSVFGVLPVFVKGPRGFQATVAAYFIGMGVRLLFCLAAGVLAVHVLGFRGDAVLLGLGGAYLPFLFVEVWFVAHYLKQKEYVHRGQADVKKEALV